MKIAFNSKSVLPSFTHACISFHLRAVLLVGRWLVVVVGVMETTHKKKKATIEPPFGDERGLCNTWRYRSVNHKTVKYDPKKKSILVP